MEDHVRRESTPAVRISVDVPLPTLLPGRLLRLTSLALLPADDVLRLEYEMTPPLAPLDWAGDEAAHQLWARRNDWLLSGRDDRGRACARCSSGW